MRLGLLARADKTGLGYQTKAYYDHLKPDETLVIDIQSLNGKEQNYWWYDSPFIVKGFPNKKQIHHFLSKIDVLLTAETPYNYEFYSIARAMGVKTVCVPNWEFFDYFVHDYPLPDMFISPSKWHYDELKQFSDERGVKCVQIHHPVDMDVFKPVVRSSAKVFHIAGYPAAEDRNGTWDFMQAFPDGRVITQSKELATQIRKRYRQSQVYDSISENDIIYSMGDILVLPRKYGGNCLPMNEALASGCPVIMPDISPNNEFLPKHWLVKAKKVSSFQPRTIIDIYEVDQLHLKQVVGTVKEFITEQSKIAIDLAHSISWTKLKDEFQKELRGLCGPR